MSQLVCWLSCGLVGCRNDKVSKMTIEKFEDLDCWKEARVLVKMIYEMLRNTEKIDRDTASQIRRAALSVMNNIAEGFGRFGDKEFVRFLNISSGSAAEVKSIAYVLEDLNYLTGSESKEIKNQVDQTRKLIHGLIRYLNSKS